MMALSALSVRPVAARPARRTTVQVQAAKLPQGVPTPKRDPKVPQPIFGFVENAERLNSRAAMIGFFSLLLLEAVANKGILELMGITVGKGINIGF